MVNFRFLANFRFFTQYTLANKNEFITLNVEPFLHNGSLYNRSFTEFICKVTCVVELDLNNREKLY